MSHTEQLDTLIVSLEHAREEVRKDWMKDLWANNVAAAALETLTDALVEVVHARDAK